LRLAEGEPILRVLARAASAVHIHCETTPTEPPVIDRVKTLSLEARKLPLAERAELIDDLLASLDQPDPRIDALWADEAERRLRLADSGEMPVYDAADVIAELRQRPRG
jgi:hypothetical protein